jgi:hypothetical protein
MNTKCLKNAGKIECGMGGGDFIGCPPSAVAKTMADEFELPMLTCCQTT